MKRTLLIFLTLVMGAVGLSWAATSYSAVHRYDIAYASVRTLSQSIEEIRGSRKPAASPLLATLMFDNRALFYETSTGTWYWSLAGTSGNLAPSMQFTAKEQGVKIAFPDDAITTQAIAANRQYTFLAYNATTYTEYKLVVTTLPIINITPLIAGKIIGDTDAAATFDLYGGSAEGMADGYFTSLARVHVRGNSSRLYPKKCYKISLVENHRSNVSSKKYSVLGLRKASDWILYAGYNDPEKLRTPMAWSFWNLLGRSDNRLGIDGSSNGVYVEAFLNGAYNGIYFFMYPLDQLQFNITKHLNMPGDMLYDSKDYIIPTDEDFAAAADDTAMPGYELSYPLTVTGEAKWEPLKQTLNFIYKSSDDQFKTQFTQNFDVNNVADLWLFLNATCAQDNVYKNLYFAEKYVNGRYLCLLAPWDFDQTWGNIWTGNYPLLTEVRPGAITSFSANPPLTQRALSLGTGGLAQQIWARWQQLRTSSLSDAAVSAMIDNLALKTVSSGALARDHARWPISAWSADTSNYKSYVISRLDYTDKLVAVLPDL